MLNIAIDEMVKFTRTLANETRLKIIIALFDEELDVGSLVNLLGIKRPSISAQIQILKKAGIIDDTKYGKRRVYSLLNKEEIKDIYREIYKVP